MSSKKTAKVKGGTRRPTNVTPKEKQYHPRKEEIKKMEAQITAGGLELRYFYFPDYSRAPDQRINREQITAVASVDKIDGEFSVAFSFFNPEDQLLDKTEGKYHALRKLIEHGPHTIDMRWSGNSFVDSCLAYNMVKEKPSIYRNSEFYLHPNLIGME